MKASDIKKLTDKQLEKLFNTVGDELNKRKISREQVDLKRKIEKNALNVNVRIWYDGVLDENGPWYSFYLDGNRCFYYDLDDAEREMAMSLIPEGFAEAMENAYEYHGSMEEAIKKLKACGITNIVNELTDENSAPK